MLATLTLVAAAQPPISDAALFSSIVEELGVRWRRGGPGTPTGPTPDWLVAAAGNFSYEQAMHRVPLSVEDAPQHMPQLQRLFAQLDLGVARFALEHPYQGRERTPKFAAERAAIIRTGSIAVDLTQQAFYWRVAASPAVRRICEVGFNAGHSTALWLSANPTATIDTFDLFSLHQHGFKTPNLHLLQRLFPGRITAHAGDSLKMIPAASLSAPCDLVHVDGRHSYLNTLWDAVNFMRKAHPSALYLFDDQCDPRKCSGPNADVAAQPSLATCDMVEVGLLEPVTAVLEGNRQFALFRQNGTHAAEILTRAQNELPCDRFCTLRMSCDDALPARRCSNHAGMLQSLRAEQAKVRGAACQLPPATP
jgi:hypothetical protein